ncbi:hypothetical protein [Flavobacterium sp.]|uniref:hypothetical protein n=1 Tax=Flavobacterium sp. TaxID=239 RepID=UPI0037519316
MKQKFKIIPKLLGVLAFFMLTNCSKDEFVENIKNSNDKNNISFEQFKKETGLINFESSISIKQNTNISSARTADGSYELSDFDIDTDIIKKCVNNEKITYTFRIEPKERINKSIFNLTMFYKDGWQSTILELKPTEQNLIQLKQGLTEKFEGTVANLYQSNRQIGSPCTFITIEFWHCTGTGQCASGTCDQCHWCVSYDMYTLCGTESSHPDLHIEAGGSSGGGGGGGSDGSSPSGNTPTTPSDNEIAILPNLENIEPDIDGNPNTIDDASNIRQLQKLTDNKSDGTKTSIKSKIDGQRTTLTSGLYEGGAMYNSSQTPINPDVTTGISTNWSNVPKEYYIKLHRHQNNYIPAGSNTLTPTNPVESDMDVANFLKLIDYTNNNNTTDLFVSRAGTFALRISNKDDAKDAWNALFNSPSEWTLFTQEYDKKIIDLYQQSPLDVDKMKNEFINFIKTYVVHKGQENEHGMGISIFEAIFDAQGNITWIKR